MLQRRLLGSTRPLLSTRKVLPCERNITSITTRNRSLKFLCKDLRTSSRVRAAQCSSFHTSTARYAQSPTADALMESLTDLYSTAKDEFEIAAEETEKKTVYAADDREAAKEALNTLKEVYERALRESDPEVAREVQTRTGPRIKELENAMTAVEEMAMED